MQRSVFGAALVAGALALAPAAQASVFQAGDLVLSIYGNGDGSGSYGDNQASPIVLREVTTAGATVGQTVLPQTTTVVNGVTQYAVSGEYGSSSEGTLQLSADGRSLNIMGYAIHAATFNSAPLSTYGNAALAQTTSLSSSTTYVPVARVVASIGADGTVDSSTAVYNVFNTNNPRSVATVDGSTFWIAGQGVKGDATQGVFAVAKGASTATRIYGGTDARTAEISGGALYVSTDSKQTGATGTGKGSANIASYGGLPTAATTPSVLPGLNNSVTLNGKTVYLSPENFYFANSITLYVADGGNPKQGGAGLGGLQKWVLTNGTWTLEYTLTAGLNLVSNSASSGTTGLIGLTGTVSGNEVSLYATNATIGDLDPTFLFGITDSLSAVTLPTNETFTTLVTATADTNIRGVAFAPTAVPEPASLLLLAGALGLVAGVRRRA